MRRLLTAGALALAALAAPAPPAPAYPLDQSSETGINRLEAFYLAREYLHEHGRLPAGALLPSDGVRLRLADRPGFTLPESDPELLARVRALLGDDAASYGVAVLDLSEPDRPRYAEHQGGKVQNPASVGKVMVALAWFQALADVYPDDVAARKAILRDTVITADEFIVKDHHTVPFWKPGDPEVVSRPIEIGDRANLYTFMDWMLTYSSSAAASQLMAELVLLVHFGKEYPVSAERAGAYLQDTPPSTLSRVFLDAILKPLGRNGLDSNKLRQGSFFTRAGKQKIPGTNSVGTAREFMRLLTLLEQGRLVDPWSSLELKRLLLLTEKRIRYASSPALENAAVYFKSGSLYGCKAEAGFVCGKYQGNRMNYMNSIAIVEEEKDGRSLHYVVVLLSNVLRKNSVEVHQNMATQLHELIRSKHPALRPPVLGTPTTPAP